MKKTILKVRNNAGRTMFVTYNKEERECRVLDTELTNFSDFNIREVEDDSSWNVYEDVENPKDWLGEAEIIDEAEIEL